MADEPEDGMDAVVVWRYQRLVEAGYPCPDAAEMAASDVDLHRACELAAIPACGPALAARILV